MILSFVFCAPEDKALIGIAGPLLTNIKKMLYPPGKIEVIFLAPSAERQGAKTIQGVPLTKLIYLNPGTPAIQVLNKGIGAAVGDLVIVGDLDVKFRELEMLPIAQSFEQKKSLGVFIGEKFLVTRKMLCPDDTECYRCYTIMNALSNGMSIIGPWGVMHRGEILRQMYRIKHAGKLTKCRLAYHFLRGI